MAKAKEVRVGRHTFLRQLDALAHFKEILNRYRPGDTVSSPDGRDLEALIQLHKDAAEKIGPGIRVFKIIPDDYRGYCFGVERTDGTTVDFSYIRCITQRWD